MKMDAAPTLVHPTAVVEPGAQLGVNVRIGAFCHVGPNVVLGDNSELVSHVILTGHTEIGAGAKIFPQAVVGGDPQNTAYKGEVTRLIVGDNVTMREGVTMHRGTGNARGETRVGDNGMFLAYSHVAHDSIIGDHVTFANNVMIGGHVTIGDRVIVGGGAGIHQFCVIGRNAFIGGLAGVTNDVIPFGMVIGNRSFLSGLNVVGMKRSGLDRTQIAAARKAYAALFAENGRSLRDNAADVLKTYADNPPAAAMANFVLDGSRRHMTTPLSGAKTRQSEAV